MPVFPVTHASRRMIATLLPAILSLGVIYSSVSAGEVDVYGRLEGCLFGTTRLNADNGESFAVQSESFFPGDYVRVRGTLGSSATICAGGFLGNLNILQIEAAFADCGIISVVENKVHLLTADGDTYELANPGAVNPGERVYVRGVIDGAAGNGTRTILNDAIGPCAEVIGQLISAPPHAEIESGDGSRTFVENVGPTRPGEFVAVVGINQSCAGPKVRCIAENTARRGFGSCGTTIAADDCGDNFQPDFVRSFAAVQLASDSELPGQDFFVMGTKSLFETVCGKVDVHVVETYPCFRGLGTVFSINANKLVVVADSGPEFTLAPLNVSDYTVGDRVYVTGIPAQSADESGSVDLRFSTVNAVLESTMTARLAFECTPLGEDESGRLWTMLNLPSLPFAGFVEGVEHAACPGLCPFPCLFILNATPAVKLLGDTNCDSFLSVGDIGPFVLALTSAEQYLDQFPGCDILSADVNQDGLISVSDIGLFVLLLLGKA
ncbi:MAG: hypothetical protein AB7N71_13735 [Phycisphaerae bacterium]